MYGGQISVDVNHNSSRGNTGCSSNSEIDSTDSDPTRGSKTKTVLFESVRHVAINCVRVHIFQIYINLLKF